MNWWGIRNFVTLRGLKSSDPEVRRLAVAQLDRSQDAKATLFKMLENEGEEKIRIEILKALNPEGRRLVVASLARSQDVKVVDRLGEMLANEGEEKIRIEIANVLGSRSDARAIPALIKAMSWKMKGYRSTNAAGAAKQAIVSIGAAAVTALLFEVESSEGQFGELVVQALGEIGDQRAIPALVEIFSAEEDMFRDVKGKRDFARAALKKLGWQADTPVTRVRSAIDRQKYQDAAAEGELAWPLLCNALNERSSDIVPISQALAAVGSKNVNLVLDGLGATEDHVRACCALAAGILKEKRALLRLSEMLLQPDVGHNAAPCQQAATALVQIDDFDSVRLLQNAMRSTSPFVRCLVASNLAKHSDQQYVDILLKLVEDLDPNVRFAAIRSLQPAAVEQTEDALYKAATDPDLAVALAAADGITRAHGSQGAQLEIASPPIGQGAASYLIAVCQDVDSSYKSDYRLAKYMQRYYDARIRRIGQALNESGGMQEMLRIGQQVAADSPHGRYLERVWHGIGEWQG